MKINKLKLQRSVWSNPQVNHAGGAALGTQGAPKGAA